MKEGQSLWTENELLLAINLYCKLPFGRLSRNTPEVIDLANLIGRTSNSVALKLVNSASLDPAQQTRGIKGMGNASRLDERVWNEFNENWDKSIIESEKLLTKKKNSTIEKLNNIEIGDLNKKGLEYKKNSESQGKPMHIS